MAVYPKDRQEDFSGEGVVADQYNVNIAGVIAQGTALTALSQTLLGIKTFNVMPRFPVNADVAAAGSDNTDAGVLLEGFTIVTGANGTLGVILPVAGIGGIVVIKSTTSGVLKIYPDSGSKINLLTTTTGALSTASGVIPVLLWKHTATQWYTLPLLPS